MHGRRECKFYVGNDYALLGTRADIYWFFLLLLLYICCLYILLVENIGLFYEVCFQGIWEPKDVEPLWRVYLWRIASTWNALNSLLQNIIHKEKDLNQCHLQAFPQRQVKKTQNDYEFLYNLPYLVMSKIGVGITVLVLVLQENKKFQTSTWRYPHSTM